MRRMQDARNITYYNITFKNVKFYSMILLQNSHIKEIII